MMPPEQAPGLSKEKPLPPGSVPEPPELTLSDVVKEVSRCNALLSEQITLVRDWRIALRNGILVGLGGVLGATVVISLALWILQPLKHVQALGPVLERLEQDVQRGR